MFGGQWAMYNRVGIGFNSKQKQYSYVCLITRSNSFMSHSNASTCTLGTIQQQ